MPTFQYRALQTNGKIAEGVLDASGRPDAMRQIETLGLRLVNLTEKAAGAKGKAGKNTATAPAGGNPFKFES